MVQSESAEVLTQKRCVPYIRDAATNKTISALQDWKLTARALAIENWKEMKTKKKEQKK